MHISPTHSEAPQGLNSPGHQECARRAGPLCNRKWRKATIIFERSRTKEEVEFSAIGERSRSGRDPLARQAIAVDDDRSALVGADPQPGGHMPVRQAFLSGGIIQATLLLATWAYETGQPPERSRRELEVSGMTTRPVQFVGHAVEKCRAGQWGQHCRAAMAAKRILVRGDTTSLRFVSDLD